MIIADIVTCFGLQIKIKIEPSSLFEMIENRTRQFRREGEKMFKLRRRHSNEHNAIENHHHFIVYTIQ